MNTYLLIKYVHELTAMWFIAGIIGRQLARHLARQSRDIQQFSHLSEAAGHFEKLMVIPGNLLVLVFGVALALRGGWPIFGFLQGAEANWLLLANILLVAGIILVPVVYVPRGKLFEQELQNALKQGQITTNLITLLDDPVVKWAHRGEYVGLLTIMALMVLKPF